MLESRERAETSSIVKRENYELFSYGSDKPVKTIEKNPNHSVYSKHLRTRDVNDSSRSGVHNTWLEIFAAAACIRCHVSSSNGFWGKILILTEIRIQLHERSRISHLSRIAGVVAWVDAFVFASIVPLFKSYRRRSTTIVVAREGVCFCEKCRISFSFPETGGRFPQSMGPSSSSLEMCSVLFPTVQLYRLTSETFTLAEQSTDSHGDNLRIFSNPLDEGECNGSPRAHAIYQVFVITLYREARGNVVYKVFSKSISVDWCPKITRMLEAINFTDVVAQWLAITRNQRAAYHPIRKIRRKFRMKVRGFEFKCWPFCSEERFAESRRGFLGWLSGPRDSRCCASLHWTVK